MKISLNLLILFIAHSISAQPEITSWLQNTTETGSYYIAGNSVTIPNNILVNCQKVEYSADYVYITTTGIPSYPTGPFQDGNPSQAADQNMIYKIPRNPQENIGTPTSTTPGNIGVFINGVALFDYRDGVAWNPQTNALCGGPGNPPCGGGGPGGPGGPPGMTTMDWNRDAIPAEMEGFDCAKGHPAMTNYHHHQNPSAFKLDINVVSDVCSLYDSDGLYTIDDKRHSPLLGYAYDGFPIYGAYGYANIDGSGEIVRLESGYSLRNITERTHHADGTDVEDGPTTTDYFLGYFREDYEFIPSNQEHYLDEHNGRFCVTPEYPDGTYAYFCTVDENWNSAYPYVVGPTFYGVYANASVNFISEPTTVYSSNSETGLMDLKKFNISIFPNPSSDIIVIQINDVLRKSIIIKLMDLSGKLIEEKQILKGQTIGFFDAQTLYDGVYLVEVISDTNRVTEQVIINK